MSRATTRRPLATPPESGARPASGSHRKASPCAVELPDEQAPAAHAPAPPAAPTAPAAPAASPLRLAPAHAALVTSMLDALHHLGDVVKAVRDLELTSACGVLTGIPNDRNVIGCALSLARLQAAHRQGADDPNEQSMNEAMASLARSSFERTGAA